MSSSDNFNFTCLACRVTFINAELQREHYRSEWHRYNLKRKVAELPPVTKEAFEKIDAIKVNDVKEWGKSKVWDRDIVISGTGLIEDLLDYNRNRNEMAMMRW